MYTQLELLTCYVSLNKQRKAVHLHVHFAQLELLSCYVSLNKQRKAVHLHVYTLHSWSCLLAMCHSTNIARLCCVELFLSYIFSKMAEKPCRSAHCASWSVMLDMHISKCHGYFRLIKHIYGISVALLCYWSQCPVGLRALCVKYFIQFLVGFRELWTIVSMFHKEKSLGSAALEKRLTFLYCYQLISHSWLVIAD